MEWKNIFAKNGNDKELIFKIHKQLIQLNVKKPNNPIKEWAKKPKQTFLQGSHTDGQQAYEKMLSITNY